MPGKFIAAEESPIFRSLFNVYVKNLFKRRFETVWINQQYHPSADAKTVYFLNHTSWWDGLIPLVLNTYCFNQQPRAMMEYEQIKKYPFFKKIGAFSVDQESPRHIRASLRYALESMDRENASLYLYPEGEIKPIGRAINFKPGIGWLCNKLKNVDFVPIGIHMHTIRHDKPELHLWVGKPCEVEKGKTKSTYSTAFEQSMKKVLDQLHASAGFDDKPYEKLL
jgi:1-acyl-sn-glycerol-3-phosphate acyltransferase